MCAVWFIQQTGERKGLQCGTHVIDAVTAPNKGNWGDINCVLTNTDCTRNINFSKALEKIVRGIGLVDVWESVPPRAVYIYIYTRALEF